MKKWISLFLAVAMLLSMTACGAAEAPDVAQTTEVIPTETEAEIGYTPYALSAGESVEDAIHSMGYDEVIVDLHQARMVHYAEIQGCTVTPKELAVLSDSFRMTFDYVPYSQIEEGLGAPEEWILYGAYAEEIGDISEVDLEEYQLHSEFVIDNWQGLDDAAREQMISYGMIYYIQGQYRYNKPDDTAEVYVLAVYFPLTGRVYNLVKYYDAAPMEMSVPWMFLQDSMEQEIVDNMAELLTMEFPEKETEATEAK